MRAEDDPWMSLGPRRVASSRPGPEDIQGSARRIDLSEGAAAPTDGKRLGPVGEEAQFCA
jgi:hypothetical protein